MNAPPSTSSPISADKANYRQPLIRDTILGNIRLYPQEGVFLLPMLDALGLYFQRPVMLTFWVVSEDSARCLLSNVENPLILGSEADQFFGHQPPYGRQESLTVPTRSGNTVWLPLASSTNQTVAVVLQMRNQDRKDECELAAELCSLLSGEHFWKEFQEHLGEGINSAPNRWMDIAPDRDVLRLKYLAKALEAIRYAADSGELHREIKGTTPNTVTNIVSDYFLQLETLVDEFFQEKSSFKKFHHDGPSKKSRFPNLHLCVASAITTTTLRQKKLPFTARLIYTRIQREAFKTYLRDSNAAGYVEQCEIDLTEEFKDHTLKDDIDTVIRLARDHDADTLLEYLTPSLREDSTATADNAFTSGSVCFGSSPGRSNDRARTLSDKRRRMAESVLYRICRPGDTDQFLFHIPLHVNGVAWLDAYTFTTKNPADDDESWTHNYLIYRAIIAEFGSQIRLATQSIYFRVIEDLVEKVWSLPNGDADDLVSELNLQCSRLALTVPFPWVRFNSTTCTNSLKIPHRRCKALWVTVMDNPFFVWTVNYRRMPASAVAERLVLAARRADDACALEQNRHVAYTAHMLKLPLRAIQTAVGKIEKDEYRIRLCEVVDWLISLEDWLSPMFDSSKLSKGSEDRQDLTIVAWIELFDEFNCYLRSQYTSLYDAHPPSLDAKLHTSPANDKTVWTFYRPQWMAVIQTLWNNACEFGRPGSSFNLRLIINPHSSREVLFVRLRNEVEITELELDEKIALTCGASINQLGIATLNVISKRLLGDSDFEVLHEKEVGTNGELYWVATVPIAINSAHSIP